MRHPQRTPPRPDQPLAAAAAQGPSGPPDRWEPRAAHAHRPRERKALRGPRQLGIGRRRGSRGLHWQGLERVVEERLRRRHPGDGDAARRTALGHGASRRVTRRSSSGACAPSSRGSRPTPSRSVSPWGPANSPTRGTSPAHRATAAWSWSRSGPTAGEAGAARRAPGLGRGRAPLPTPREEERLVMGPSPAWRRRFVPDSLYLTWYASRGPESRCVSG